MPSMCSSSGSLSKARFRKFLVSLCVGSPFHLHRVGVFDEEKPLIWVAIQVGSAHMSAH
jgi:hypothetical protein